jgi:hypothetical protein
MLRGEAPGRQAPPGSIFAEGSDPVALDRYDP